MVLPLRKADGEMKFNRAIVRFVHNIMVCNAEAFKERKQQFSNSE